MRNISKTKIFCIGHFKTGTTSLKKAFQDLGYDVGDQRTAEQLIVEYMNKDFRAIIDYCHSAQVFQDFPFACKETYKYLDEAFPDSKFILSVRDNSDQWYNSLINFHSKKFGKGKVPNKEDLMNATYIYKGYVWQVVNSIYGAPEDDPYNKQILINYYNKHNEDVINYFHNRPNDLLIINLSEKGAYQKFCDFLGIDSPYKDFPWENKTSEIPISR